MYPIPLHEFRKRLQRWETAEDRHRYDFRAHGRRIVEYWSLGVCRLRVVYHRDGAELLADRGVKGWPPKDTAGVGPIAFTTWDEPWRPPEKPKPVVPDVPDWAE